VSSEKRSLIVILYPSETLPVLRLKIAPREGFVRENRRLGQVIEEKGDEI